jgi:hypothetical protein
VGYSRSGGRSRQSGRRICHSVGSHKQRALFHLLDYGFSGFLTTASLIGLKRLAHVKALRSFGMFFCGYGGWFLSLVPAVITPLFYSRVKPTYVETGMLQ